MITSVKSLVAHLPAPIQGGLRMRHYMKKLEGAVITDEPELGVVPAFVGEGDVVFDIGANFGLFTRFLSEAVGPRGRVFSFEPTPDMFAVLANSTRKLGFTNVGCFNLAVSDRAGMATMSIPVRKDGSLNHYEATLEQGEVGLEVESFTAEMVTLDGFCKCHRIEQMDFIKCDVEGHEIPVLRGASEVIRSFRPTILLEVNEPLHLPGHGAEVRAFIEEIGYSVFVFDEGGLKPLREGDVRVNYVLQPSVLLPS